MILSDKKMELAQEILTHDAVIFLLKLHRTFNPKRESLLAFRTQRQISLDKGQWPHFLEETKDVRLEEWKVAQTPKDLENRHIEITGPVEEKMMINALNSGANVFMADFEDSLSPTRENILQGQINLKAAVRKTLKYTALHEKGKGKEYRLNGKTAILLVRPRGWHLVEKNFCVDGQTISASLFDFGLYFFHNAYELLKRKTAPYFYLPKLENHMEARLWNDVFNFSQDELHIPRGTIRATVLIETILAAFEMEEILYELKDHISGLNAGRWDYIFSIIKKFRNQKKCILPDRSQVTMTVPFMRAYTELLVRTCHKRGAYAMGGMAAFVPSRKDPSINELAFEKVREDKEREVKDGFDGTWVAHPDLVSIAKGIFDRTLGNKAHQKQKLKKDVNIRAEDLLDFQISGGKITEAGVVNNISVALQYLNYWLQGTGAAAIYNLMEDAATAEISRAQLWQWVHHEAILEDGRRLDASFYRMLRDQEVKRLGGIGKDRYTEVVELLDGLVLSEEFTDFLTIPAYVYLN